MLYVARVVVFTFAIIFAIIVLGLAAEFTHTTRNVLGTTFNFAALAISTAAITIVTLPILMIVDCFSAGAVTSMIIAELIWIFVLWVLWVATAADAAHFNSIDFGSNCSIVRPFLRRGCREVQTVEGFSFIIWIMLLIYWVALLIMALIGRRRGRTTWKSSVRQGDFLGTREGAPVATQSGQAHTDNTSQPPMQQQQTPMQAPPPNAPSQGYSTQTAPQGPYQTSQGQALGRENVV
ncbi:hypothetical protein PILCRDRAFT_823897 [Piloderma croceum F 1598]|uniref:MARVEL domain-containing protein n=1 Tax=Piloderma croceum (strain F 1598) TaxID=765440 RepID=A0A0C3FGF7_PILCF|nr:hypothetical protein PILCRDRAFT_823897 [Piloderma croceum F 1598]